ncbi:MAG: hypothetical protein JWQ78_1395 [Sediminibacterium sp.]|nr:hypothetical protein [Sediminibacterium sp.]
MKCGIFFIVKSYGAYSVRKLFAGLALAACIARKQMVMSAMNNDARPATTRIHTLGTVR